MSAHTQSSGSTSLHSLPSLDLQVAMRRDQTQQVNSFYSHAYAIHPHHSSSAHEHKTTRQTRTALPISTCQGEHGRHSPQEANKPRPRRGYDATGGRRPRAPRGLDAASPDDGSRAAVGPAGGGSGAQQLGGAGLQGRDAQPVHLPDVRGVRERADAAGQGLLRCALRRRRRGGRLRVRARRRVRLLRGPRRRRARARAAHHLPRRSAASQPLRRARHARRGDAGRRRARGVRIRHAGDDAGNLIREQRPGGHAREPTASSSPRAPPPVLRRAPHAAAVTPEPTRHGITRTGLLRSTSTRHPYNCTCTHARDSSNRFNFQQPSMYVCTPCLGDRIVQCTFGADPVRVRHPIARLGGLAKTVQWCVMDGWGRPTCTAAANACAAAGTRERG